jgi:Rod binding domain-containing protein
MEQVMHSSRLSETEKVSRLAQSFEALLLRQVLENAQKPLLDSSGESNSTSASIYRDMITNQMAESIAASRTVGLGQVFEKQLHTTSDAGPKNVH